MTDILSILQWWIVFLILGIFFLPLTGIIFRKFIDKGYIFSKILALALSSYLVFLFGIFHIAPFSIFTILLVIIGFTLINASLLLKNKFQVTDIKIVYLWILEEALFLIILAGWSYIRSFDPSINGLEKFMDYGFVNSIIRAEYFPPKDMWLTPFSINYYYYGHYITAFITMLSGLQSNITYNLMLATLCAFTFTQSFSIVLNLVFPLIKSIKKSAIAGILSGALVTFGGNLHTIYAFFESYNGEEPVPFWTLAFKPFTFFMNGYWYPNATRFIPNTIHEFPLYSFVVSDLHGHVLDIPFVLFILAFGYALLLEKTISIYHIILASLIVAVMYMTNAWDGAIYLMLLGLIIVCSTFFTKKISRKKQTLKQLFTMFISMIQNSLPKILLLAIGFILFTLPFNMNFEPFVSGIGVLCTPSFLTNIGSFGPFLFEANHCQRSPIYMLFVLYGFFYFFVFVGAVALYKKPSLLRHKEFAFTTVLVALSTLLIIIPEIIYVKDIYPDHYRANTMFKLTYQAFIMLSLVSAFVIATIIRKSRNIILYAITLMLMCMVLIYPRFAIYSYYADLKNYSGIDGTVYLEDRYPEDYKAIVWINNSIKGQPVILEAQGDSYTDYARISSNTGLPTVLGWTVHEWLWRGTYDVPQPRIEDIQTMYESASLPETKQLLKKFKVEYVYIGDMEREKYPNIQEEKFRSIAKPVYSTPKVTIYQISE